MEQITNWYNQSVADVNSTARSSLFAVLRRYALPINIRDTAPQMRASIINVLTNERDNRIQQLQAQQAAAAQAAQIVHQNNIRVLSEQAIDNGAPEDTIKDLLVADRANGLVPPNPILDTNPGNYIVTIDTEDINCLMTDEYFPIAYVDETIRSDMYKKSYWVDRVKSKLANIQLPKYFRMKLTYQDYRNVENDMGDVASLPSYLFIFTPYVYVSSADALGTYIRDTLAGRRTRSASSGDSTVYAFLDSIDVEVADIKNAPAPIFRVAEYQLENCVINVIRASIGDRVNEVYNKFPELKPKMIECSDETKQIIEAIGGDTSPAYEKYIYLDEKQIHSIAKYLNLTVVTYSALGELIDHPWKELGRKKRTKVLIKIAKNHATVKSRTHKIQKIEYHDKLQVPETTNVVCVSKCTTTNDVNFYITQDPVTSEDGSTEYVKTIHKCYRPSILLNDAEADKDLRFKTVTDDVQLGVKLFKIANKLGPIDDESIRKVVKASEIFPHRSKLAEIPSTAFEYDHNRSFCAYESNPYYRGFPFNMHAVLPPNSESPAFYAVEITDASPDMWFVIDECLGQGDNHKYVLTAPMYDFLRDRQVTMAVDYIIEGTFNKISIFDFANGFYKGNQQKLFMNTVIGASITGGIKETRKVRIPFAPEERQQLEYECALHKLSYSVDNDTFVVRVPKPSNGAFNFHSYILSYSAISVMSKMLEIRSKGYNVFAYSIDAIFSDAPTVDNLGTQPGQWKQSPAHMKYNRLNRNHKLPTVMPPRPKMRKTKTPRRHTLYIGPGGIGKTYTWLHDPVSSQWVLAPRRRLKERHREASRNIHKDATDRTPEEKTMLINSIYTAHKYFQFTISESKRAVLRFRGSVPQPRRYLVIDECTMFSYKEWEYMIETAEKDGSIIIALGDFEQIVAALPEKESIDGEVTTNPGRPVTIEFFKEHGFDVQSIERKPENSQYHRHEYKYGCYLDQYRGRPVQEQYEQVLKFFSRAELAEIKQALETSDAHLVSGNHKEINQLYHALQLTSLLVVEKKGSGDSVIKRVQSNDPNIWWGRRKYDDTMPKEKKYEPISVCTIDSLQGETIDTLPLFIQAKTLRSHGALYVAITRPRTAAQVRILEWSSDAKTAKTEAIEVPFKQFYDYNIVKFSEPNMVRTNLGGENGNRAFYFEKYSQYEYQKFVEELMKTTGEYFNINEFPDKYPGVTRTWLDIDMDVPKDKLEKIEMLLECVTGSYDNKVLQSTAGKVHIVVDVPNHLPISTYTKDVRGLTQEQRRPFFAGLHPETSPLARRAVKTYFSRKIRAIIAKPFNDAEWSKVFDMGALGLRSAYSVKLMKSTCQSRGFYKPWRSETIPACDIKGRAAVIADCSIYKYPTGTLQEFARLEMEAIYAELVKKEADDRVELEKKLKLCGFIDGPVPTIKYKGQDTPVTQELLDQIIKNMPDRFLVSRTWLLVCGKLAKASQLVPGFDNNYFLHEWSSRNTKEYDRLSNENSWKRNSSEVSRERAGYELSELIKLSK